MAFGGARAKLIAEIDADTKGFTRGMDKAEKRASGFGKKLAGVGKIAAGGLAVAGIAAAGAAAKLAADFLQTGDALHKMNIRTGVSVENLQKLDFAAQQSGSDLETLEKAFLKQSKVINDANSGLTGAVDKLDALGLSAEDLIDLSPDEQFKLIADAMKNVTNDTEKAAIAQEIFGKSGADLIPLLNEGADGINRLSDQAAAAGNIMSADAATAAAEFNDRLNVLKQGVLSIGQKAFAAMLPILFKLIETLETIARVVREQVQIAIEKLQPVIEAMSEYWNTVLLPALQAVSAWINDNLVPAVKFLADIIMEYVQIQVEFWKERMDFLITVLKEAWEIIRQVFVTAFEVIKALWDVFSAVFRGDWSAAWEAVKDAFQAVWDLIKQIFESTLTIITSLFGEFGEIFAGKLDLLKEKWESVWEGIKAAFEAVWELIVIIFELNLSVITGLFESAATIFGAVLDGLKLKFTTIWNGILSFFKTTVNSIIVALEAIPNAFAQGMNAIIRGWNNFSIRTPPVRVLGKTVVPSVTFNTPNIATLPRVKLPRLASGGIVNQPTVALIGEAGPEAVIPLNGRNAGGVTVNLFGPVYGGGGQQLADEVITALTEWQRINGPLPSAVFGR